MKMANKKQLGSIGWAIFWTIIILLFPILSGTVSVVCGMNTVQTLFLQGLFMTMSLIIPFVMVRVKRFQWKDIGFEVSMVDSFKSMGWLLPVILLYIPLLLRGFYFKSAGYVFGSFFLYLMVGISEEIYFRGIIPYYLRKTFGAKAVIWISTFVFGIGHIATALAGNSIFEVVLTIINAFLFGFMAMEIALIAKNLFPIILIHFLFDFESKIVAISGAELLATEIVRGALMFLVTLWFLYYRCRKLQK